MDNCRIEVELRADLPDLGEDEEDEEDEGGEDEVELGEEQAGPQMQYEGQEMPLTDGSAMFWADMVKLVQIRPAHSREGQNPPPKKLFAPQKVGLYMAMKWKVVEGMKLFCAQRLEAFSATIGLQSLQHNCMSMMRSSASCH